jgi:hypothetical protein
MQPGKGYHKEEKKRFPSLCEHYTTNKHQVPKALHHDSRQHNLKHFNTSTIEKKNQTELQTTEYNTQHCQIGNKPLQNYSTADVTRDGKWTDGRSPSETSFRTHRT